MKKKINVMEYANEIMSAMKKGILLTTKSNEKINSMVISWGALGIEWQKPIFTAYVRQSRFTKEQLNKNPEFTINIPTGAMDPNVFKVCGSQSGYQIDKIKELGLTPVSPDVISVPGIKELPLTLECKVLMAQPQDTALMSKEQEETFYPIIEGTNTRDFHTVYYAEIVAAYIIED